MCSLRNSSYPLTEHDIWLAVGYFAYKTFRSQFVFGAWLEVMRRFEQKNILYWFIEGQAQIGMSSSAKMSLDLNEPK